MKQSLLLWSAGRRSTRTINVLLRFQHLPTLGCGRPLLYGEKMSRQSKGLKSWLSSWSPCLSLIVTFSLFFPFHPFSSSLHPLFLSSYLHFVFLVLILISPVSLPISSSFFPFSPSLPHRFFHSAQVYMTVFSAQFLQCIFLPYSLTIMLNLSFTLHFPLEKFLFLKLYYYMTNFCNWLMIRAVVF